MQWKELRTDRRTHAQVWVFENLTTELTVGRCGLEVQFKGIQIGVKEEKPNNYDGGKLRNVDTWLFQVQKHLNLMNILVVSLLCGNAAMWWRKLCENNNRLDNWN